MKFLLTSLLFIFGLTALASPNVGIIVKKKGDVQLLTSGSKKFIQGKDIVLYESLYYIKKKVKVGLKIQNGDILKTGKDSKARVVYKNGDQFNVGEGSAFKISWKKDKVTKRPVSTIQLLNGSLRGIISKKGPRNNLNIKSKNAVMGVRGTDFHFSQKGTSGETAISVLRGQVEVASKNKPNEKRNITQGFSAELSATQLNKELSSLIIGKTSKTDLVEIQKESKIEKQAKEESVSEETRKELASLEKAAIKTTLEDIKEYQPEVYKTLEGKKITQIDTINTIVVSKAVEKAPLKKSKKGIEQMGIDFEEDSYKKYFKIEDSL